MANNPLPIIVVLILLKNKGNLHTPALGSLELEAFIDNARSLLNTVDKINGFAQMGGTKALPDMKKLMEIVEKIPL